MKQNNLKQIDIIKDIKDRIGFSEPLSKKIIKDLIVILNNNIKNNFLILKNIGTFKIIDKKAREGRNPKTKERFIIKERKTVSFISSKKLIKFLNI